MGIEVREGMLRIYILATINRNINSTNLQTDNSWFGQLSMFGELSMFMVLVKNISKKFVKICLLVQTKSKKNIVIISLARLLMLDFVCHRASPLLLV